MKKLGVGIALIMLGGFSGWASAQEAAVPMVMEEDALPDRDQIYGFELMTRDERKQYREQYEVAKSNNELRTFLANHRKRMQERARALGFGTPEQAQLMAQEGVLQKGAGQSSPHKSNDGGIHNYLHY
jgi:type IV secretory pathway TrbF-like protein